MSSSPTINPLEQAHLHALGLELDKKYEELEALSPSTIPLGSTFKIIDVDTEGAEVKLLSQRDHCWYQEKNKNNALLNEIIKSTRQLDSVAIDLKQTQAEKDTLHTMLQVLCGQHLKDHYHFSKIPWGVSIATLKEYISAMDTIKELLHTLSEKRGDLSFERVTACLKLLVFRYQKVEKEAPNTLDTARFQEFLKDTLTSAITQYLNAIEQQLKTKDPKQNHADYWLEIATLISYVKEIDASPDFSELFSLPERDTRTKRLKEIEILFATALTQRLTALKDSLKNAMDAYCSQSSQCVSAPFYRPQNSQMTHTEQSFNIMGFPMPPMSLDELDNLWLVAKSLDHSLSHYTQLSNFSDLLLQHQRFATQRGSEAEMKILAMLLESLGVPASRAYSGSSKISFINPPSINPPSPPFTKGDMREDRSTSCEDTPIPVLTAFDIAFDAASDILESETLPLTKSFSPSAISPVQTGMAYTEADYTRLKMAAIAYQNAYTSGKTLQKSGINFIYGPVADSHSTDGKSWMKSLGRTHSSDPMISGFLAWLTLSKTPNVTSVIKHAPGIGALQENPEKLDPDRPQRKIETFLTVADTRPKADLLKDLIAFRLAFSQSTSPTAVMVSGAAYPALETPTAQNKDTRDPQVPAIFSPIVVQEIRTHIGKNQNGQEPVLIADDIGTPPIMGYFYLKYRFEHLTSENVSWVDLLTCVILEAQASSMDVLPMYSQVSLSDAITKASNRLSKHPQFDREALRTSVRRILTLKKQQFPQAQALRNIETTLDGMNDEQLIFQKFIVSGAWQSRNKDLLQKGIGGFAFEGVIMKQERIRAINEALAKDPNLIPPWYADNSPQEMSGAYNAKNFAVPDETTKLEAFAQLAETIFTDGMPESVTQRLMRDLSPFKSHLMN